MKLPPSTDAPTSRAATQVFRLDNGLQVVVREDHFAPVTAVYVWVKAGGADERDEELGAAHVHEHMLFKGTKHRGVGEIAAEIESSGGRINAWTSWDETVYHVVVASRHTETAIEVLADAMRYSSFDPDELAKELQVVLEEWRRGEDSPSRKLFYKLFETAYRVHPYRRPVIGTKESILGLTREKILDFYRRFYVPDNMTLVVVGDVDPKRVRQQVERLFGDFEARPVERPPRPAEPPQTAMRVAETRMSVQEAQLGLAFHIGSATDPEAPLIDMLAFIIGGGESSRLYRRLVASDEIATEVSAFAYTPQDPGVFVVTASMEADKLEAAYRAAIEELAAVRDGGVTPEELARARRNLEADFIFKNETVQGQARELGFAMTVFGDLEWDRRYLSALASATPDDLRAVARRYLARNNMSVVSLLPEAARVSLTRTEAETLAASLAETPAAAATVAEPATSESEIPDGVAAVARDGGAHTPTLERLPNGVRIIVQEHRDVPVFSIRAAMIGGLLTETRTNNGISNFVAEMLTRGTDERSRERFASDVESIAGSLDGSSGYNSIGLAGSFLSAHRDEALDLFFDALLTPAFDPVEVEKARRELLFAIKTRDDNPARVSFDLAYATAYPDHPYGMTTLGETASVSKISPEDLRTYHRRALDPERLVVSVVGDVETTEIVAAIRRQLGALEIPRNRFELPPPPPPPARVRRAVRNVDRKQAHIVVAYQSVDVRNPDRYPLSVLDNILSGQGGRLFYTLRDQQSLAYSVTAFFTKGLAPGLFGGYIATDPANTQRALEGLLTEFERVRTEPVDNEELERAQRYLMGTRAIGLQTNSAKAEDMCLNELYGLGYRDSDRYDAEISKVRIADVARVAQTYLDPEHRAEVIVGPKEATALGVAAEAEATH